MTIKYKIIAANPAAGQITVRYWTNDDPEGVVFGIDVPIIDRAFVTGDALIREIMARAPLWHFERRRLIEGADFAPIAALVQSEGRRMRPFGTLGVPDQSDDPGYRVRVELKRTREALASEIAEIRGTVVQNLPDYEAKLTRLSFMALSMATSPREWRGKRFDGKELPDDNDVMISDTGSTFLRRVLSQAESIEQAVARYEKAVEGIVAGITEPRSQGGGSPCS